MVEVRRVGDNQSASVDVVLLHGLGGDGHGTWSYKKTKSSWPDWLAEDDPRFAVWCVDYPASATRWRGTSMPIRDRATNLLAALRDGHDIGSRPFVLVGHSLGGLLIKQIVRHSDTMGDQYSGFCDSLAGVVFLSTPHTGAGLASLMGFVKATRATPLVKELATDHAYLRELDDWYRGYATRSGLAHLSFYETRSTKGLRVVGASSGNPHLPGATAIPVDADHLSVCKFPDRLDLTYVQVKRFLSQALPEAAPAATPSGEEPQAVAPAPVRPATAGDGWSDAGSVAEKVLLALLSEQLPSGGWARSLARWMTAYATASEMQAPDRPPMREHGGIDVTCAALNTLVSIADGGSDLLRAALQDPLRAGADFLRKRTALGGAVGATIRTRTAPTEVRIRHTAITLATLLRLQRCFGETHPYPEAVRSARYLLTSLDHWRLDTSGTFGMISGAWALYELLADETSVLGPHLSEQLQNTLSTTVDEMAQEMERRISAVPADASAQASCARFGAYGDLTAMAQSSFLFSAKHVTALRLDHASLGLAQQFVHEQIIATCRRVAHAVVHGENTREGLLTVPTPGGPHPDIGLSVQALSVLQDLRRTDPADDVAGVAADLLRRALDRAFTSCDEAGLEAGLRYTHGVQFTGLLGDPEVAGALHADRALHLTASRTGRRTLTRRDLTGHVLPAAGHRDGVAAADSPRAWARAWSRVLENGYYLSDDQPARAQGATTAWRPTRATAQAVRRMLQGRTGAKTLWLAGEAEESAGLVPPRGPGVVTAVLPDRADPAKLPAYGGFDLVYLPTLASSSGVDVLLGALRLARNSLAGADAQAIVCVRFGDHRLVSEAGEGVLFVENSARLEDLLHECRLRLLGIDITDESLDGAEAVVRFSASA